MPLSLPSLPSGRYPIALFFCNIYAFILTPPIPFLTYLVLTRRKRRSSLWNAVSPNTPILTTTTHPHRTTLSRWLPQDPPSAPLIHPHLIYQHMPRDKQTTVTATTTTTTILLPPPHHHHRRRRCCPCHHHRQKIPFPYYHPHRR